MIAPAPVRSPAHIIRSDDEALAVARDVAETLAEGAIARDRERRLPAAEMDLLSSSGLLAISVPRAFGGAEVRLSTVAEVLRILSVADPAIGQLPQNHFFFVEAIRQDGTFEQQAFFFASLLGGARLGNAQAERGSASALDLATRVRREGDGHRLSGTKYYCTGAILAHWIPVAAIDDEGRLVLVIVARDADGVEVLPDWNVIGQRTTYSGTTHLRDVAVDPSQVIPHWRLFERQNVFHAYGALLHAAVDVGIARAALDDTRRHLLARRRPRLGARATGPLDDPHLLLRLGELVVGVEALEALLARAGALHDAAHADPSPDACAAAAVAASGVKAYAEDVGLDAASDLFALLGSSATDERHGLDRHWRNLRTHSVHDANQWRYHQIGAWHLLGEAPSKPIRKAVVEEGEAAASAARSTPAPEAGR